MEFRIEATTPTDPSNLGAALTKARNAWLESTPQNHDPSTPEGKALADAEENVNQTRRLVDDKNPQSAKNLVMMVNAHRDLVRAQSASPNAEHRGALELIDTGIAMAIAGAARSKSAVRCSVVGHFDIPSGGVVPRPLERLSVHLDHAGGAGGSGSVTVTP